MIYQKNIVKVLLFSFLFFIFLPKIIFFTRSNEATESANNDNQDESSIENIQNISDTEKEKIIDIISEKINENNEEATQEITNSIIKIQEVVDLIEKDHASEDKNFQDALTVANYALEKATEANNDQSVKKYEITDNTENAKEISMVIIKQYNLDINEDIKLLQKAKEKAIELARQI